jgi:hypothetical protein
MATPTQLPGTPAPLPPLPSEIYAVFNGPLDQEAVTRIFKGLTAASTNGVKQFHLLFQSQGGGIGESIALYNLFRALPFDLTLYNVRGDFERIECPKCGEKVCLVKFRRSSPEFPDS